MTDERLNELEAIANAATPGNYTLGLIDTPDERLIVAACNSLRPLIAALREAWDEVERLKGERSEVNTAKLNDAFTEGTLKAGDARRPQIAAAFQRGVAAMREAAIDRAHSHSILTTCTKEATAAVLMAMDIEEEIRALPNPEDKND